MYFAYCILMRDVVIYNCPKGERGRKCRPDERGCVRKRGGMDFHQLIPTTKGTLPLDKPKEEKNKRRIKTNEKFKCVGYGLQN